MKYAPWVAAALAFSTSALLAQPTPIDGGVGTLGAVDRQTTTDEMAIGRDGGHRMTVAVSVAGQGPYQFLVDTGSERTVISRQLANRLQLESGRNVTLHSVAGINDVKTVRIPHLTISNKVMSVNNAPALEASSIGADGMLGIDSLRSQKVLFDFKAGTMSITPAVREADPIDKDTIVVRARARQGRLIFTQARIGNQKVTVIVDTGSQVTIGNLALERALARRRVQIDPEQMAIESVTGEMLVARSATLRELQLGSGVALGKLPVAFANAHVFRKLGLEERPALLLGMNAMKAFDRISIDFASKKVRFVLPATSMRDDVQLAALRLP
jgi:predicted aspartyl protease